MYLLIAYDSLSVLVQTLRIKYRARYFRIQFGWFHELL